MFLFFVFFFGSFFGWFNYTFSLGIQTLPAEVRYLDAQNIWVFPKMWYTPKSSILNMVFHYINHPFWGKHPYFWKHPYLTHQTSEGILVSEFEVRILSECPMHRRTPSTLFACGGWEHICIKVAVVIRREVALFYTLVGANLVTLLLKVANHKSTLTLQKYSSHLQYVF